MQVLLAADELSVTSGCFIFHYVPRATRDGWHQPFIQSLGKKEEKKKKAKKIRPRVLPTP